MIEGQPGSVWTNEQNDLIVADYFAMLADELAGRNYVKSHRNSALQSLTGRNRGSIERKHMNISAVMERLGLPRIKGYAPNANFQAGLIDAVERCLSEKELPSHPASLNPASALSEERALWIGPPPMLPPELTKSSPELERLVRKFDPAARDERNRSLGKDGELLVFEHEVRRLETSKRSDLAKKVEWTSQERGDGAGFDIASFETDGRPRLIEVKTTNGSAISPFYLSENERSFSEERPEAFTLLRLYNFAERPMAFELRPPLGAALSLMPTNYRATPMLGTGCA
jgi:Domain of unknown function (DUF3883)